MSITLSSPILDGIDVPHITAYLGASNWKRRANFPRKELVVFEGPPDDNGEPIEAVFPSSARFSDFRRRLVDLLEGLAVIENRPSIEIALDMLNPSVDRLRARVISEFASTGSIPLSYASVLVKGLQDLIVAAVCTEDEPRPFYPRAKKIGGKHADLWRLGQTQLGSFVATLECPVTPPAGRLFGPSAPPFERRVTERIMRGLGRLHTAVMDGRIDPLVDEYKNGLNANMCEALLSLRDFPGEAQIEFGVSWSKRLQGPADLPSSVLIEERGFEFLHQAARVLRQSGESEERELRGHIVKLSAIDAEFSASQSVTMNDARIATLRFIDERGVRQHAKMSLGVEDYKVACEAHRDNKLVTVHGRLEREGKQWRISGVHAFGVVDLRAG